MSDRQEKQRLGVEIIVFAQSGNHVLVLSHKKKRWHVYIKQREAEEISQAFNIKIQIR